MYNSNFYNRFPQNATFQHPPMSIPPPPCPPPFFIPPMPILDPGFSDQQFVKQFERRPIETPSKEISVTISSVKDKLQNLILTLNTLKDSQKHLIENMRTLPEEDWSNSMNEIETTKFKIDETLQDITSNVEVLGKLLAKRSAKRLRMKRVRNEDKMAAKKQREEISRKINETLQKIKDDNDKAKQDEEAKLQADIVLKEVIRKKQDARKYLVKLDALIKLRRARHNTAKGRGDKPADRDAEVFNGNIEKLKKLWTEKLALYEKEEAELRATLQKDTERSLHKEKEHEIILNLQEWKQSLFGGNMPQIDFQGDSDKFVQARYQWDKYLSTDGTVLPMGWVVAQKL